MSQNVFLLCHETSSQFSNQITTIFLYQMQQFTALTVDDVVEMANTLSFIAYIIICLLLFIDVECTECKKSPTLIVSQFVFLRCQAMASRSLSNSVKFKISSMNKINIRLIAVYAFLTAYLMSLTYSQDLRRWLQSVYSTFFINI